MRRREFIFLFCGAAARPLAAYGQQSERLRRVGALVGFAEQDPATQRFVAAFVTSLGNSGWAVGRNISFDFRYGAGNPEKNQALANELVALRPDVIFVNSTSATLAVQRATSTIPVVFATVSDPVGSGIVTSLAHPGGNITGFINVEGSIAGKWLGLLEEVVPGLSAAGLMYNPATATYFEYYLKPFLAAAQATNVRPFSLEVGNIGDIEQAFRARAPGEGIVAMSDPFLTVNSALIQQMELQVRVPVVSGVSKGGSLISYAPNTEDLFRRSGSYVGRILRGESPADLPVQLPSKFDLIVNMRTAAALGLKVPQTILAEADDVIE